MHHHLAHVSMSQHPTTLHLVHHDMAAAYVAIASLDASRRFVVWPSYTQLQPHLGEIEILVAATPPLTGWGQAPRLRLVQSLDTDTESWFPLDGLVAEAFLCTSRGLFAAEVSEFVIGALLALVRDLPGASTRQAQRQWTRYESPRLAGLTMAVLGLGEVGRRVSVIGRALGMHVLGVRAHPIESSEVDELLLAPDLEAALCRADVLVVALPATPATRGLIDANRLALLPAGARMVVVGRGVADEQAIAAALVSGHLAGAALDVFTEEPLSPESPLWTTPGLLVTPHVAGLGTDYLARCLERALGNMARIQRGQVPLGIVDRA